MFSHDSFFFVGVFVIIFLFWLITGGPAHPIAFTGPLLSAPGALGGGTYISLPQAPNILGNLLSPSENERLSGGNGNTQIEGVNFLTSSPAQTQTVGFGPPSPFRDKVYLSHYVSRGTNGLATGESIDLRISQNASGPINISGWALKSEVSGNVAIIPQGTEVPLSGVINESEPIILNPGDNAIIASARSPIGASFRENICIGYFGEFQTFSPSLPNSCPTPLSDVERFYGGTVARDPACIDFADRQRRCTVLLSPPTGLTTACQSFLTTYLNYNGCVQGHLYDSNFKSATWRVYLARDTALWRSTREIVKLVDSSGKTVDMFSY